MRNRANDRAIWGLILLSLVLLGAAMAGSLPADAAVPTGSLLLMLLLTWLGIFWLGSLAQRGARPKGPRCVRCGAVRADPAISFCAHCGEAPAPAVVEAHGRKDAGSDGHGRERAPSGR